MAKKLIITIDGGGIRGILPLIVLRQIQLRLPFNLYQLQPSWWGTSTGALISASMVVQQKSEFISAVQNVLDIYEFRSTHAIHPHGVSIPTRALDQLIDANFGNRALRDYQSLNIIVTRESDYQPVVFNAVNSVDMAQAVKASCAFPGVFPSVEIGGVNYVDGFFKAKNPAHIGFEQTPGDNVVLLSLGTGILRERDGVEESVELVDKQMRSYASGSELNYFRFNPVLRNAVDSMQNTSPRNILNLRRDALDYVSEMESEISELVELLKTLYQD